MAQTQPLNNVGTMGARHDENLAITTSNAYADATQTLIDARNLNKGIISILSKHATAGITYAIYGSVEYNSGEAPARASKSWKQIIPDVAVAGNQSEPRNESWSMPFAWIRIDVKSTVTDTPGTVDIWTRGVFN